MREDLRRRLAQSVGELSEALRDTWAIRKSITDEELDALLDMDILAVELRMRLGHLEHGREDEHDA